MDLMNLIGNLGPVAGTVVVVLIFTRVCKTYFEAERRHREKLAADCHAVQAKSTETLYQAREAINRNTEILEKVNVTLIRLNGQHKGDNR